MYGLNGLNQNPSTECFNDKTYIYIKQLKEHSNVDFAVLRIPRKRHITQNNRLLCKHIAI